jgi:hypothetical protein
MVIEIDEHQMALESEDFDLMLLAAAWQLVAAAKAKREELGYPTSRAKRLVEVE